MNRCIAATLMITLLCGASLAARAQSQGVGSVVAEGTKALLELQSPLNSKLSEVGDPVIALLEGDVRDKDGRIAIPKGAEFSGRVTQVQSAGRPQKQATMTIVFETVRLASGVEPISVVITAIDNHDEERKLKAKDDAGKVKGGHSEDRSLRNAAIGMQAGLFGSAIIVRESYTGARIGFFAGIVASILISKGNDIKLLPETTLRIRFVRPLTLPERKP